MSKLLILAGVVFLLMTIFRRRSGATRKRKPPRVRTLEDLAALVGESPEHLRGFEPRYRLHRIPKRRGGTRTIHAPAEPLKALQRQLLRSVIAGQLRAHAAAHGFEKGRSIVTNAAPHISKGVVVKLDVRDFFASTHADRVERWFRWLGWNEDATAVLLRLTTWEGGLPQGAPTSPALSNRVNVGLDQRMKKIASRRGGSYTRYADDLTFSFSRSWSKNALRRRVTGALQEARGVLRAHGYEPRHDKQAVLYPHRQQRVTGLVVNERVRVPRATRRWLRAVEHHQATGRPTTLTDVQLAGWRAFMHMVEGNKVD